MGIVPFVERAFATRLIGPSAAKSPSLAAWREPPWETRPSIPWEDFSGNYDAIRERIARVVPDCEDYNTRVRVPGGFAMRNAARERDFTRLGGRAKFTAHALTCLQVADDKLILTTIRSHDQFNTTIYGMDDRYRGIHNERRVIFMNAVDMSERNLRAEQPVDLTSHFEDGERLARLFLVIPYDIPRGCAAAYFPETNVLVPLGSTAAMSRTPTSKSIVISVAPSSV